jgi:hypothetical protein
LVLCGTRQNFANMRPHSIRSQIWVLLILGLPCLFLPFEGFTNSANHLSADKKTAGAKKLHLKMLTTGQLSLYKHVKEGPAVPFEESYAPDTAYETEWYLYKEDTGQTVQVTKFNYKSVFKLLLTSRPDIVLKLGKRGYRFKDIQAIIKAYNLA